MSICKMQREGRGTITGSVYPASSSKVCLLDYTGSVELVLLGDLLLKPHPTQYRIAVHSLVYGGCVVASEDTCTEVERRRGKRKRRRYSYDLFVLEKCSAIRQGGFSVTAVVEEGASVTVYLQSKWFYFIRPGRYYRIWFTEGIKAINGVLKLTRPKHGGIDIELLDVMENSKIKAKAEEVIPGIFDCHFISFQTLRSEKSKVTPLTVLRVELISVEQLEFHGVLNLKDEFGGIERVLTPLDMSLPPFFVPGAQLDLSNLFVREREERTTFLMTATTSVTLRLLSLPETKPVVSVSEKSALYTLPPNCGKTLVNVIVSVDLILALVVRHWSYVYCKVSVCDGSSTAVLHLNKPALVEAFFELSAEEVGWLTEAEFSVGKVDLETSEPEMVKLFARILESDTKFLVRCTVRTDESVYAAGNTLKLPRRHLTPLTVRPLTNEELFKLLPE